MTIQTRPNDRRTMVHQISEHLEMESRYQGPPTFSYTIGPVIIARDGSITCEDAEVLEALKPFLLEKGFIEPEDDALEEPIPTEPEADALEGAIPTEPEGDALEGAMLTEPEGDALEGAIPTEPEGDALEGAMLTEPEADALEGTMPTEPEVDMLEITMPTEGMNRSHLRNLMHLLFNYQYLLNRITRRESFFVSEGVPARLKEYEPETLADFEALMGDFTALGELNGVDFKDGTVALTFPLDAAPEKAKAYADLASAMVQSAREAKRISVELRRPENEKYVLRSWLLRLGFGGPDYKASRNALLSGLKGHTAFRNDDEATKHKVKYAEIRRVAREAREGEAQ